MSPKKVDFGSFDGAILMALPPYMTAEKYGEMVGLSESTVLGMMGRNHIASVKVGRRNLVNVLQELQDLKVAAEMASKGVLPNA